MKTNAIIRIILFSLAILILSGILFTALAVDSFMFDFSSKQSTDGALPMAGDGSTNTCAADPSQVTNIQIEWAAGSIDICRDMTASSIIISETDPGNEKYSMVCETVGDTLKIQYSEAPAAFSGFGINRNFSKDLVIHVPKNWTCDSLEIDAASAALNITDLTIGTVDFDSASGDCFFDNCHLGTLDLASASGDVDFSGTLDVLNFDAASADFRGVFEQTPASISFDGVSGDLDLTFPGDCGFTASLDSLSGDFVSEFPTTLSNGNHICGDGRCRIEANSLSGDITIRNGGSGSVSITAPDDSDHCTIPNCTDANHGHTSYHQDESHNGSSHEKDHH